ncbi:MAG: chorismate synthase [Leptospiraceae bacterium]|nr:chorismate synthase [Leptospiraceae bacterium]MDW7975945.1 chorismate synthase [Leptospiraceae bacterium]
MSSTTNQLFRVTTFGESHGPAIGVVIDGCPAGIEIDFEKVRHQLQRRRPGQSRLTTQRKETEEFEILSGIYKGKTLGTPLAIIVRNIDIKSEDYLKWADIYRPSHADYTYHAKYAYRTPLGGGRASVRETVARVIAGSIAAQILKSELEIETIAWVNSIGEIESRVMENPPKTQDEVDASPVRCPDQEASEKMIKLIEEVRKEGDSLGGTIGVIVRNVPPGLGEPVFDKLDAEFAKACLSIPACKGFESGSGFSGTKLRGSQHNDSFFVPGKEHLPEHDLIEKNRDIKNIEGFENIPLLQTRTNHSGGIQGGISNGMPILMRLAFKPTASIHKIQKTVSESGEPVNLLVGGRHDPCVLPRAVPIVESVINLVLIDMYFRQRAIYPKWWLKHAKSRN